MNVDCRKMHGELLRDDLIIAGFMPQQECHEVADSLHWIIAQNTETHFTSSSDVAGIAYCLCRLSFEILSVENFGQGPVRDTGCRLIYNKAPLFNGREGGSTDARQYTQNRELSTAISLTQPEETFSTFPISRELANRCRTAWEEGVKAGECIHLGAGEYGHTGFTDHDFAMRFSNNGTPVKRQRRTETKVSGLSSLLTIFDSQEIHKGLEQVLGRIPSSTLGVVAEIIRASDEGKSKARLTDETILEAFTAFQAFFMGYYYQIFSGVIDSSLLEIKTVVGFWGYGSAAFLNKMQSFFHGANSYNTGGNRENVFLISRTKLLNLLANLYANMEYETPQSALSTRLSHRESCVGVVGKRIILARSLLHTCRTVNDIASFVILDSDSGGIPRAVEGLVLTGVPDPFPTWEGESPKVCGHSILNGPQKDCTRHIEANWDGIPERILLCIRYKGRRLGALNPAHADIIFWKASIKSEGQPRQTSFGPAHECELDDFIVSARLVTPGRHQPDLPVVVHSRHAPTLRYAAAAWYFETCDVVLVNECFQEAMEHWMGKGDLPGARSQKYVALIG